MNINLRHQYKKVLSRLYGFDEWHIGEASYGELLVRKVNWFISTGRLGEGAIVEIGCGMGDILMKINVPWNRKYGYDIDEKVISAGRKY